MYVLGIALMMLSMATKGCYLWPMGMLSSCFLLTWEYELKSVNLWDSSKVKQYENKTLHFLGLCGNLYGPTGPLFRGDLP